VLGALVAVRAVRKVAFAAMSRGFPFPAAARGFVEDRALLARGYGSHTTTRGRAERGRSLALWRANQDEVDPFALLASDLLSLFLFSFERRA
jgi:hypothetical protein